MFKNTALKVRGIIQSKKRGSKKITEKIVLAYSGGLDTNIFQSMPKTSLQKTTFSPP